jgi:sarcosine oxidase gamma subunit
MIYYMGFIIGACACCIFCDIQLNLYCMIDCIVTVLLFSISDDRFYICVQRSFEDTLNMNMNMSAKRMYHLVVVCYD